MALPRYEPGTYPETRFLKNAEEARISGYDLLCAECGSGMDESLDLGDDDQLHDILCPNTGRDRDAEAAAFLAKRLGQSEQR